MNRIDDFGRVAVLMGGYSAERAISLETGGAVLAALKRRGVNAEGLDLDRDLLKGLADGGFDRVFIALHGRGGEDGQIQGALETLRIPYTGSGVLGSALALDKWRTKLLWQATGISTPRSVVLDEASDFKAAAVELGVPLIVKPSLEGSTIGLSKVMTPEGVEAAYRHAARYDFTVLGEEFIDGVELTASILGEVALPLIRIEAASGLYDYEAKYVRNDTRYLCPCGLSASGEQAIQRLAVEAFKVLGCRGWGRVDLIVGANDKPYFLEANTVPGLTSHSLVPMAAKAAGIDFDDLVLRILATSGRLLA